MQELSDETESLMLRLSETSLTVTPNRNGLLLIHKRSRK